MDHACKIIPLQMRLPLLRSLRSMSHRNVVFQIVAIPVFLVVQNSPAKILTELYFHSRLPRQCVGELDRA
jgi:hypothetical protein